MARQWFGRQYNTGELVKATCYQSFTPTVNISLKALRIYIIVYGDPVLTELKAHIYTSRSSAPYGLLMTSTNSYSKAQITTSDNGAREIYFEFTPKHLLSGDTYFVTLSATSYTGNDSSHIAWAIAFPDPVYEVTGSNNTLQTKNLGFYPQTLTLIGALI
jgi:hypothetical protein